MKRILLIALALASITTLRLAAAETEEGFVSLMDGKTFDGWKASIDNPDTWKIEDGAFVTRGKTDHLFYVGPLAPFTNFDLKVDVYTEHGANGGIYFDTQYQARGFPRAGLSARWTTPTRTGRRPAASTT